MINKDFQLLNSIKEYINDIIPRYINAINSEVKDMQIYEFEYPLDQDVLVALGKFEIQSENDDYHIFNYTEDIKLIWRLIIDKSIKCLRYFDHREPFIENSSKHPVAYGVKELSEYFEKYSEFESMLYGGGKYYRDHLVHVFRVWLLGLDCLLDNNGEYLDKIVINDDVSVNSLEKLCIWSMIALTHDLGYPLEKSREIIDKTKDMMKSFVSDPMVSMDLSFNGVQSNMNDFVVRFISSKMHLVNTKKNTGKIVAPKYVARLQPKYYFKLQKSLEGYNHGILSSIIIYKLLIYFLESDFNINEDYQFDAEDARQFYIRREILRSISSHTCHDIYHLDMLSFSFLLIVADEAQGWGRKRISELYIKPKSTYEFDGITLNFNKKIIKLNGERIQVHQIIVKESFAFPDGEIENLEGILKSLLRQSESYEEIFRDGQDTAKRNFTFVKQCDVTYEEKHKVIFLVEFQISNDEKSSFSICVKSISPAKHSEKYGKGYLQKIFEKESVNDGEEVSDSEMKFLITKNK